jgi:hypothetical protein
VGRNVKGPAPLVKLMHMYFSITWLDDDVGALATLDGLMYLDLQHTNVAGGVQAFARLVGLAQPVYLSNKRMDGDVEVMATLEACEADVPGPPHHGGGRGCHGRVAAGLATFYGPQVHEGVWKLVASGRKRCKQAAHAAARRPPEYGV